MKFCEVKKRNFEEFQKLVNERASMTDIAYVLPEVSVVFTMVASIQEFAIIKSMGLRVDILRSDEQITIIDRLDEIFSSQGEESAVYLKKVGELIGSVTAKVTRGEYLLPEYHANIDTDLPIGTLQVYGSVTVEGMDLISIIGSIEALADNGDESITIDDRLTASFSTSIYNAFLRLYRNRDLPTKFNGLYKTIDRTFTPFAIELVGGEHSAKFIDNDQDTLAKEMDAVAAETISLIHHNKRAQRGDVRLRIVCETSLATLYALQILNRTKDYDILYPENIMELFNAPDDNVNHSRISENSDYDWDYFKSEEAHMDILHIIPAIPADTRIHYIIDVFWDVSENGYHDRKFWNDVDTIFERRDSIARKELDELSKIVNLAFGVFRDYFVKKENALTADSSESK